MPRARCRTGELNQSFDIDLPEHSQTKILVKNESGACSLGSRFWHSMNRGRRRKKTCRSSNGRSCFVASCRRSTNAYEPKHPFVILLEPLQPNGIGEAVLAGIVITQVDVIRETDPFAEVVEGNTMSLRSVPHGRTRILWKEPGLASNGRSSGSAIDPDSPSSSCQVASGRRVTKMPIHRSRTAGPRCRAANRSSTLPTTTPTFPTRNEDRETIWHQVGYPAKERDDVIALHTSTGLWPARFGEKDWVWCFWNDHECRWQVLAIYEDHSGDFNWWNRSRDAARRRQSWSCTTESIVRSI